MTTLRESTRTARAPVLCAIHCAAPGMMRRRGRARYSRRTARAIMPRRSIAIGEPRLAESRSPITVPLHPPPAPAQRALPQSQPVARMSRATWNCRGSGIAEVKSGKGAPPAVNGSGGEGPAGVAAAALCTCAREPEGEGSERRPPGCRARGTWPNRQDRAPAVGEFPFTPQFAKGQGVVGRGDGELCMYLYNQMLLNHHPRYFKHPSPTIPPFSNILARLSCTKSFFKKFVQDLGGKTSAGQRNRPVKP